MFSKSTIHRDRILNPYAINSQFKISTDDTSDKIKSIWHPSIRHFNTYADSFADYFGVVVCFGASKVCCSRTRDL